MREKDRIHRIMMLLEKLWESQPDTRFNQLIANLQSMYTEKYGYGKRMVKEQEVESYYLDFFNLEDTEWEDFLHSLLQAEGEEEEIELHNLIPASNHEDCSYFYINENNVSILTALDLKNKKVYPLYHDDCEDDYYIINEKGKRCYSIDVAIKVDMLKQVN